MSKKQQPNLSKLAQTFGLTECATGSIHYVGQETIAYLSGFSLVFFNYQKSQTVHTLNLGENITRVRQVEFFNNNTHLITCEERPEGATVSVYSKNQAGFDYEFQHRIFVTAQINGEQKTIHSILTAKFISASRLAVITGAPSFMFLVYENDQKTAVMPTYSLKISQENIIDQEPEKIKLLQLSDKELLLVAGKVLKTIRLQQSITKILPPNNFLTLSKQYTFTDGIYLNKVLKKRFPGIPIDSDQVVLLSTLEGALIIMLKTTIVREFQLDFIPEITSLCYVGENSAFAQASSQQHVIDDSQKNFTFFQSSYEQLQMEQENSSGFLVLVSKTSLHFLGLRISELFRFICKNFYAAQTNWERFLEVDKLFIHLLSYNVGAVSEQLIRRSSGLIGLQQAVVSRTEQNMLLFCSSETSKGLIGLKMQIFNKRLNELDRMWNLCSGKHFRMDLEKILNAQTDEVKKLIAQDQFTQLKGEVVDLKEMGINVNQLTYLNRQEDEARDQSAPYDIERNREIWYLQPQFISTQTCAISTPQTLDKLVILSKDRMIRIFTQQFQEITLAKSNDAARGVVVHPSGQYVTLIGPEYIDVYRVLNEGVEIQNRFKISYCNYLVFLQNGELMICQSGTHLHVFDFYERRELFKIDDFSGRIMGIQPVYRDFTSKNQFEVFVYTQDGSIVLIDLCQNTKIRSIQLKVMHVRSAVSASSILSSQPLLIALLNDATVHVFNYQLQDLGQIPIVENDAELMNTKTALGMQTISGAASNDVICPINDGEVNMKAVYKGIPLFVQQIQNYLIVGFSLGYVIVKQINQIVGQMMNGVKANAKEKEQVVCINSQIMVGLQPTADNTGFIVASEDSTVHSYKLYDGDSIIRSINLQPLEQQFVNVPVMQMNKMDNDIDQLKFQIYQTKLQTAQKKAYLTEEFHKDMDQLVNQTTELTSQHQSEQTRLKTEHENKTILLKRQIANNEKLFQKSKEALENQYKKRQLYMNDDLKKLDVKVLQTKEQLEEQFSVAEANLQKEYDDENKSRNKEIEILKQEVKELQEQNDEIEKNNEEFYKEAENELYIEGGQLEAYYYQKHLELDQEMTTAKKIHQEVKEEYQVLEQQLQDNQKKITEKNLKIQELKNLIQNTKKDIDLNKQEILQHDATINQREKRIQELDQKIRELNKISFILQFKIRELRRTIKPKEGELEDLKLKIEEMNKELSQYRLNLASLQSNKKDFMNKNASLKQQIDNTKETEAVVQKKLDEVRGDINGLITLIIQQDNEYKALLNKTSTLPSIGRTSARTTQGVQTFVDRNIQYRQLVNQIKKIQDTLIQKPNLLVQRRQLEEEEGNYSKLESNVVKLQQKVQKQKSSTKSSTSGVMAQNAQLLQEINQLRRELHQAMVQANSNCQIDEGMMKTYEQNRAEIQRLRAEIRAKERQAQTAGFLPELQ
ncbi:WD40_repeat protein [Hexamita inflata]|uniref:WD40 repeat protein n=1 Tax=Hexamita inflata TaxID=28002 RepID=A0AA86QKH0_9EUKA|nr:WD40 repeat protein [Hexamita inflata]